MSISSFCIQQRQEEQQEQTKLLALGLVASAAIHGVVASAVVLLYEQPQIAKEPIELILVDRPKPEIVQPKKELAKTPPPKPITPATPKPLTQKKLEPLNLSQPKPKELPQLKVGPTPKPISAKPAPRPKAISAKPSPSPTPKAVSPKPAPAPTPKVVSPKPAPTSTAERTSVKTPESLANNRSSSRQLIRETQPFLTSPTQRILNSPYSSTKAGSIATEPSTPSPFQSSQPIDSSSGSQQLKEDLTGGTSTTTATNSGNNSSFGTGTVGTNSSGSTQPSSSGSGWISCISRCQPSYPSILNGVEGSASVRVVVDQKGNVTSVTLAGSHSNSQINRQALLAARQMKFSTPGVGGQASVEININFTVAGSEFDRLAREREERSKRERQQRQAQLERERQQRQAQLEAERQQRQREQKEKEAKLQLETQQRQIELEAERQQREQKEREAQLQEQELEKKVEPAAPAQLSPLLPEE